MISDEGLEDLLMDLAHRFFVLEEEFDGMLGQHHLDEPAFENASRRLWEAVDRLGAFTNGILADGVDSTRQ